MAQHDERKLLDAAMALHQAGELDRAQELYQHILGANPKSAPAIHFLGLLQTQHGDLSGGIDLMRKSITLVPNEASFHVNLAQALHHAGQIEQTIIELQHANQLQPNQFNVLNNLGALLRGRGNVDQAIQLLRKAVEIDPNSAAGQNNLGNALLDKGLLEEAAACFSKAIERQPQLVDAHVNLGIALASQNRVSQAIDSFRRAIALQPDHVKALGNLANALTSVGQLDDAIETFHRALKIEPDNATIISNLGNAMADVGKIERAIDCYRRASLLDPTEGPHSNLVYAMHFDPATDRQTLIEEHARWAERHAAPLRDRIKPHHNSRNANRRLRIGYVSPDFRRHPVGVFLNPILANHDRERFEIFCYSNVLRADAVTPRFQRLADHWRSIIGISDDQAADLIRSDQIDILVDLTQHMLRNRILLFARKPAPVQISYLGYNSTTGLDAIDWRISDWQMDPTDAPLGPERVLRLPGCYWCYAPPALAPQVVSELPAIRNGFVTFASMNNLVKVNARVIETWSHVLNHVANSRLLIALNGGRRACAHLLESFESHGVSPQRIELLDRVPYDKYFPIYDRIDIALDPFPYNGGTTTLDSLWMGVPVVTLAGDLPVGRAGVTLLHHLGMPELIAASTDGYVKIATNLATDVPLLTKTRADLRSRMQVSPLMDCAGFTRGLEGAIRSVWNDFCSRRR